MTAGEIISAANAVSAAWGCAAPDDEEREIGLLNLAVAELWGLSEVIREAKGLESVEYGDNVRVTSPEDEMTTEDEICPALAYYLASALVTPDAPIMGSLLRQRGVEAAEEARRAVRPAVKGMREAYLP